MAKLLLHILRPMPDRVTFSRQSELPRLPVPTLEESCGRYLRSLEALQTPEQHAQTKEVVHRFLQHDGPQMQRALEEYAAHKNSYIEEFWDDSYLLGNESVVLNLNPFFILEDEPDRERGSQLWRAATLTLAFLSFVHDLRHEVLKPDEFRGKPLDMFQYSRLFGMARIPTAKGCYLQQYRDSRHIVVMRRGLLYWFEVLDKEDRPILTESALVRTLRSILRDADSLPPEKVAAESLGVFTTEKRRTWSEHRETLFQDPINRRNIDMIDSALFVLCLDDIVPESISSLTQNMLCGSYKLDGYRQVGTCLNRWYDKLQLIVCANGTAGVNFEHSSADGHTVLRFVADAYAESVLQFARSIHPSTPSLFQCALSPYALGAKRRGQQETQFQNTAAAIVTRTSPKRFEWKWSPSLLNGIRYAEMRLSDLICQNESFVLEFKGYGKQFITHHGFSPDAFVQMAFQATYYTLYGYMAPTYEPAMTKTFLRGRTETIRTVQPETFEFVTTWSNKEKPVQERLQSLRVACESHATLSKQCAAGHGFDRHLYALQALFEKQHPGESLPEFFQDEGYKKLNHVVLSTSNCGNPALRIFGFGPVVQDGFGLGYIIHDNKLTICASSKHLQTERFLKSLQRYFADVQEAVISVHKAANFITTRTYIDHSGTECDMRTGLPVGTRDIKQDVLSVATGTSGYSFYGDNDGEAQTHVPEEPNYDLHTAVGKLVFVNEYE